MSYFTSITFHVFNFSFKLSARPSNFEKRYKICVITVLGTYMKPWRPTQKHRKPSRIDQKSKKTTPKLAEATETNN